MIVPAGLVMTGGPGGAAISAVLADPMSVLAARSPGGRPAGALANSKPIKAAAMQERVLSDLRDRPLLPPGAPSAGAPSAGAPGAVTPPVVGEVLPNGEQVAAVPGDVGPAPILGAGGGFLPGGITGPSISVPGGGSPGGGGGTGVTPETPVTPPVVAVVPEPGTWLTLLVGFGLVGGGMRARRRRLAATPVRDEGTALHTDA